MIMEVDFTANYIFNLDYSLRMDKNRAVLVSKRYTDSSYCLFIHPVWALMLSYFDGSTNLGETLAVCSRDFGISEKEILTQLEPLIENERKCCIKYDELAFWFPEKVIVKNEEQKRRTDLIKESFLVEPPYDYETARLNIPNTVMLILNTVCVTDCIYCYADKRTLHKQMSLEKILNLIDEAHSLGVINFDLSGGEVFKFKGWEQILKKLYQLDSRPYLSTKVPLAAEEIDCLYDTGARKIQISLDSLNPQLLQETLKVPVSYADKIKETILNLDKKGFEITIKSTLTRWTCTVENLKGLVEFMKTVPHIRIYTYTAVAYSHYKSVEAFNAFKPTMEQINALKDYFKQLEKTALPFVLRPDLNSVSNGTKWRNKKIFRNRAFCTANLYGLVILPDGQVTICEELYWNPDFIIGDVTKNSIMEVWQSERAMSLWRLKREQFPEDSPCKTCEEFEACRYRKGVCWKEIIANYGKEHYLYPDVHCPRAPKPLRPVYYDNSFLEK